MKGCHTVKIKLFCDSSGKPYTIGWKGALDPTYYYIDVQTIRPDPRKDLIVNKEYTASAIFKKNKILKAFYTKDKVYVVV